MDDEKLKKNIFKRNTIHKAQKWALIELVNSNNLSRKKMTRTFDVQEAWNKISIMLNSMPGATKTPFGWRKSYNLIKRKQQQGPDSSSSNDKKDSEVIPVQDKLMTGLQKQREEIIDLCDQSELTACTECHVELEYLKKSTAYVMKLIRIVAQVMQNEKKTEKEALIQLCKAKNTYCVKLPFWYQMRSDTLIKLNNLINAQDLVTSIKPENRMSINEWLMFDLLIVNQDFDVIGSTITDSKDKLISVDLFNLVVKFNVEELTGDELAEAWSAVTMAYNKDNRACTPMLLQRRWYQIKLATRKRFTRFWSLYQGDIKRLPRAEIFTPTPLQTEIVKRYKNLLLEPFISWDELIAQKKVILRDQFERIALNKKAKDFGKATPPQTISPTIPTPVAVNVLTSNHNSESDTEPEIIIKDEIQIDEHELDPIKLEPSELEATYMLDDPINHLNNTSNILDNPSNMMDNCNTVLGNPTKNVGPSTDTLGNASNTLSDLNNMLGAISSNMLDNPINKDNDTEYEMTEENDTQYEMTEENDTEYEITIKGEIQIEAHELDPIKQETNKLDATNMVDEPTNPLDNTNNMTGNATNMLGNPTNMIGNSNTVLGNPTNTSNMLANPSNILGNHTKNIGNSTDTSGNTSNTSSILSNMLSKPTYMLGNLRNMLGNPTNTVSNPMNTVGTHSILRQALIKINEIKNTNADSFIKIDPECIAKKVNNERVSLIDYFKRPLDKEVGGIHTVFVGETLKEEDGTEDIRDPLGELKIVNGPEDKIEDLVTATDTQKQIHAVLETLVKVPIVYTTKLDDMNIPLSSIKHVNKKHIIEDINTQSKPTYRQKNCKGTQKYPKRKRNRKKIKLSSSLFKKPKHCTYDYEKLDKNPDFNIALKKLTPRFFKYTKNRLLLASCKRLTIDVSKQFENKLVNGKLCLANVDDKTDEISLASLKKNVYDKTDEISLASFTQSKPTINTQEYTKKENINVTRTRVYVKPLNTPVVLATASTSKAPSYETGNESLVQHYSPPIANISNAQLLIEPMPQNKWNISSKPNKITTENISPPENQGNNSQQTPAVNTNTRASIKPTPNAEIQKPDLNTPIDEDDVNSMLTLFTEEIAHVPSLSDGLFEFEKKCCWARMRLQNPFTLKDHACPLRGCVCCCRESLRVYLEQNHTHLNKYADDDPDDPDEAKIEVFTHKYALSKNYNIQGVVKNSQPLINPAKDTISIDDLNIISNIAHTEAPSTSSIQEKSKNSDKGQSTEVAPARLKVNCVKTIEISPEWYFKKFKMEDDILQNTNKILLTTAKFPPNFKQFLEFRDRVFRNLPLPGMQLDIEPNGRVTLNRRPDTFIRHKVSSKLTALVDEFYEQTGITKFKETVGKTIHTELEKNNKSLNLNGKNNTLEVSVSELKEVIEQPNLNNPEPGQKPSSRIKSKLFDISDINETRLSCTKTVEDTPSLKFPVDIATISCQMQSKLGGLVAESLHPILTKSELYYAYYRNGMFFHFNMDSGSLQPINLRIKRPNKQTDRKQSLTNTKVASTNCDFLSKKLANVASSSGQPIIPTPNYCKDTLQKQFPDTTCDVEIISDFNLPSLVNKEKDKKTELAVKQENIIDINTNLDLPAYNLMDAMFETEECILGT